MSSNSLYKSFFKVTSNHSNEVNNSIVESVTTAEENVDAETTIEIVSENNIEDRKVIYSYCFIWI